MESEAFEPWPDLVGAGDLPGHARIAHWLEGLIVSGSLKVGDKLPAEVDMAAGLGVSRMTLRQAFATVESKGLLQRRRGRFGGSFVSMPRFDFDLSGLPGFTEQMRRAHVEAGAQVISATTRACPSEALAPLRLRRGDLVHQVIRVRSANGEPVALEEAHFPAGIFDGMLEFDLTGSLYQVMSGEFGRGPFSAEEIVEPVKATPVQADLLNVGADDSLLLVTRTASDRNGVPVEYSRDYFRPDRTRIVLHTQVDQEATASFVPLGSG